MLPLNYYLQDPWRIVSAVTHKYLKFLPDKLYLSLLYRAKMGKCINWKNPHTFNEKLQWLKLYNRKPEQTTMVDKYAVKNYVAELIGSDYIIPTFGAWEYFDQIDFDLLPKQFVLKTTHGGGNGGVVVCRDKTNFDRRKAREILEGSLRSDIYRNLREWPYKNVERKIIAEKYIQQADGGLTDYKFFCFDGHVDCVMVCLDRHIGDSKFYFFDQNWNLLRLNKRGLAAPEGFTLSRPANLDKMFEIASILSKGHPFVRVDLYNIDGKIYFGELTFFPASGTDSNILPKADNRWGKLLSIENIIQ